MDYDLDVYDQDFTSEKSLSERSENIDPVCNDSDIIPEIKYVKRLNNEINYAKSSVMAIRKKQKEQEEIKEAEKKKNEELHQMTRITQQRIAELAAITSKKFQEKAELEKMRQVQENERVATNLMNLNAELEKNQIKMKKSKLKRETTDCCNLSKVEKHELLKAKQIEEQKKREEEILAKLAIEKERARRAKLFNKSKSNIKNEINTNKFQQNNIQCIFQEDIDNQANNKIPDYTNFRREYVSNSLIKAINFQDEDTLADLINIYPEQFTTNINLVSPQDEDVDLASPEFDGLWAKHSKIKMPPISENQKIVNRQVPSNLKLTNKKSFVCKPSKLQFINFDVGETYCKKLSLTNATSTSLFCRLEGCSPQLKDCIQIEYQQKGQLSAGIKCDAQINFTPKVNEDLDGEIYFESQCGVFAIPVVCRKKRIKISVDLTCIDFGQLVHGSAATKYVTLTNSGALPAKFTFTRIDYATIFNTNFNNNNTVEENNLVEQNDNNNNNELSGDLLNDINDDDQKDKAMLDNKEDQMKDIEMYAEKVEENMCCNLMVDTGDLFQDFVIGEIPCDHVPPNSSVKLPIAWQPKVVGQSQGQFKIFICDGETQDIEINTIGEAVDSPLSLTKCNIDFSICIFGRTYQDQISVKNSGSGSYKCRYEVCSELSGHLDLSPSTFEVKAGQSIVSQIKFNPKLSLLTAAPHCFDSDVNVLDTNIFLHIENQGLPLSFSLQAALTTVDISSSEICIDFGCCSVYESVASRLTIVNHAILPQKFKFQNVPSSIEITPDNGSGVLLPNQTMEFTLIFMPTTEGSLCIDLKCVTEYSAEAIVRCMGASIRPPLYIHPSPILNFPPTAIGDSSNLNFMLCQGKTNCCVDSWLYEFKAPEHAPITFLPHVGQIKPGQMPNIGATFEPNLDDTSIRKEALRLLLMRLEAEEKEVEERIRSEQELKESNESISKKSTKMLVTPKASEVEPEKAPSPQPLPTIDDIVYGSKDYLAGKNSLFRRYASECNTYRVHCCVASLDCRGNVQQFPEYTIVLEINCCSVRPELSLVSNGGDTTIDFGAVLVGGRKTAGILIQNISDSTVMLQSSCLDDNFELVNAMRCISANALHNIIIAFSPQRSIKYKEALNVIGCATKMHLVLVGRGVPLVVSTNIQCQIVDVGNIVAGDSKTATFELRNESESEIKFSIVPIECPTAAEESTIKLNKNGMPCFGVSPQQGDLAADSKKEISINFYADRPGKFCSLYAIYINNQKSNLKFEATGSARARTAYLRAAECDDPLLYSLAWYPPPPSELFETKILEFVSSERNGVYCEDTKIIRVGCLREAVAKNPPKSGKVNTKSTGNTEWNFENSEQLQTLGFHIDPIKGTADIEKEQEIVITWTPTDDYMVNKDLKAVANCTIKGNEIVHHYIVLIASMAN